MPPRGRARHPTDSYHRLTVEDIEPLAESEFAAIARTSLLACLKISKLFVAYWRPVEGLVAVALYRHCTTDPRAAGYAEEVAAEAFERSRASTRSRNRNTWPS